MFGFLGMFLNRADAEALSSERHYAIMEAIQRGALEVEAARNRQRAEFTRLKNEAERLEQTLEQANIGAESYRDFVREIFTTAEQRAQVDYRRWRHADRLIDARLRDGRLTHDPRKDPEWREYMGYVPPRSEDQPGNGQ